MKLKRRQSSSRKRHVRRNRRRRSAVSTTSHQSSDKTVGRTRRLKCIVGASSIASLMLFTMSLVSENNIRETAFSTFPTDHLFPGTGRWVLFASAPHRDSETCYSLVSQVCTSTPTSSYR
ncbi:uncharacterized protein LOC142572725 isoform X3 [Dermacentor variabilis]|uniref:uncharacterized protein LOC142572725 isoform X3 n=1 Tax=Dermacentor variabilis TaxID=34621 RepID=UPI003F5C7083